ncbi:MAG: Trehalose monomycolate exporter MmpL3 [Candidatus Poseidoniaceae archaeon]|nr:MAG: Trehalose monomycolate exporter MmpL3 [Candidatus Poseidoniaceae archaeon]
MESVTDPKLLEDRLFYKLGELTHDRRKIVLAVGLIACLGMGSLIGMGADWAESWGEGDLESIEAGTLRDSAFTSDDEGSQSFILLVHHESLDDSSETWRSAVEDALSKFSTMDDVTIQYSWEFEGDERDEYVYQGDDGFWAKNRVSINQDRTEAKQLFADNKESIEMDDDFGSWRTGEIAIDVTFDTRIQDDLVKAELISGPLTVLILGIVFGTIISALLPFGVAVLTVLSAVGLTIWLSNTMDVTVYALNIITLIGIGVSVDYSLFLVNRFREELNRGRDIRTSTAMTVATAGKAVFFSGITVAIGLMGMLFFENTGLPSLGIGGTLAVSVAMIFSVIVLPAFMAILGPRVFYGKIPFSFSTENDDGTGIWARIATTVMDKPWAVLVPTLVILLGAGLPFLYADFSIASRDALPPHDETRVGFEHMDEKWPEGAVNVAMVVLDFDGQDPLAEDNLRAMHNWMLEQIQDKRVITAFGYALPDASMNESSVVAYWQTPDEYLTAEQVATREYLRDQFLSGGVTYIIFSLNGPITGEDGRGFVADVREDRDDFLNDLSIGDDGQLLVAGFAAYSLDVQDAIVENLPIALAFIFISTVILIFIQVRSVIIPIKAIIMNILSISATFGMLVFVFQWGYGESLLNFTAQPIETTNPVIIFCIVFGLSMDYEVLMLSRIHEEWEVTGDNTQAVANGLQKTGRLITGAAAIMVVVFMAFGLSSVVILKQIGLGLALAIFLDATIVRALVVPSTMRLMGKWNWWSPKWIERMFSSSKQGQPSEETA